MHSPSPIAILVVSIASWQYTLAATVAGSLRGNVRWTAAQSPVEIAGEVVVERGATLTIDPGVEVVFQPTRGDRSQGEAVGYGITVRGTLRAVGSATHLVVFRPSQGTPADPSGWHAGDRYDKLAGWNQYRGITFEEGAVDGNQEGTTGCLLKFCRFVGGHSPVVSEHAYVTVSHCHFVRCGAGGDRGTAVRVERGFCEYSLVEWSGEVGYHLGGEAVAEFCAVAGGFGDGLRGEEGAEFTNCLVRDCRGYAVSPVGGEFDLYYSRFERCGAGFGFTKRLPQARPHFENCDFLDLGEGTTGAAFVVEPGAHPAPGALTLEGLENRVLCQTALLDQSGGAHLALPNVWWGGRPARRLGAPATGGGSFVVEPVVRKDPHEACIEHVGKVVDSAGQPVPGALVYALFSMAPVTLTDSQGQYRLEGAMPGMYDLYAYAPGRGLGAQRADWGFAGEKLGNLVALGRRNYNPQSEHLTPRKQ